MAAGPACTCYVILASLRAHQLAPLDAAKSKSLMLVLARKHKYVMGLHFELQLLVKRRMRDAERSSMTHDEATEHALKKWDLVELTFDFGGGGGDPGSGGAGSGAVLGSDPARPAALDVRTKAMSAIIAEWCVRRLAIIAGAFIGRRTTFVEASGDLGMDLLWLIDDSVRRTALPHQFKRELSFEVKLVQQREQTDALRRQVKDLEATCTKLELEPVRLRRHLNAVLADSRAWRAAGKISAEDALKDAAADRKEERRQASAKLLAVKKEWQVERDAADERATRLQADITGLERQLLRVMCTA